MQDSDKLLAMQDSEEQTAMQDSDEQPAMQDSDELPAIEDSNELPAIEDSNELPAIHIQTFYGFKYKVCKTLTLIVFWITCGIFNSVLATTLVDFKEILHTDFHSLGIVLVFRTVGSLVGCVAGSLLKDKAGIKSELIIGIVAATCCAVNLLKPWSKTVIVFGVLNSAEGFGQACANTVSNALLLFMWGEKASMPVHAFHFGYGLGAFLGPLIAKDFLSVRCPSNSSLSEGYNITKQCENSTEDNPVILHDSRLEVPFSIVGSLLGAISNVFFVFYIYEKCSSKLKSYQLLNLISEEEDNSFPTPSCGTTFFKSFYFLFGAGIFFLYMCINTFEGVVYAYLFTFAFESHIGFSKQEAAYLLSAFLGSYTGSRLVVSFVAHCVTVKILIFIETIGSLGALLAMTFYGFETKLAMWISACCLGVFVAPIWPSGLSWADRYIPVKATVVAATDLGAGISGAICSWLAGHLIEINQIPSYLYVASSGCACALLLLISLQVAGHRHGDRHKTRRQRRDDDSS